MRYDLPCLRLKQLGLPAVDSANRARWWDRRRPATAQRQRKDFDVDYVATQPQRRILWRRSCGVRSRPHSVFLPRSDRADERLPSALREAGAEVTDAIAYRTTAPQHLDPQALRRVRNAEVDAILFASPSAFHNLWDFILAAELAALSTRLQFAAIGPTTARALREAGVRVDIEAREPSVRRWRTRSRNIIVRHSVR